MQPGLLPENPEALRASRAPVDPVERLDQERELRKIAHPAARVGEEGGIAVLDRLRLRGRDAYRRDLEVLRGLGVGVAVDLDIEAYAAGRRLRHQAAVEVVDLLRALGLRLL